MPRPGMTVLNVPLSTTSSECEDVFFKFYASSLDTFSETSCIREEQFVCTSQIVRRYLVELRQEDLHSIENQLKDFKVKVRKGKGDADFDIYGNKEGLARVKQKLDALINNTVSEAFEVKQPGLRNYFESGKGDLLVKSVEKDQNCAIEVQKNFGQRRDELHTQAAVDDSVLSGIDDDLDDVSGDSENEEAAVSGGDGSVLVMTQGQKISWRPGTIETEKVGKEKLLIQMYLTECFSLSPIS